ncbi:hypothetical protein DIPPA_08362 [Diplonema papillatum]|nr:hypothetical protein DIPPA_08362 [Diplonema papillatum]
MFASQNKEDSEMVVTWSGFARDRFLNNPSLNPRLNNLASVVQAPRALQTQETFPPRVTKEMSDPAPKRQRTSSVLAPRGQDALSALLKTAGQAFWDPSGAGVGAVVSFLAGSSGGSGAAARGEAAPEGTSSVDTASGEQVHDASAVWKAVSDDRGAHSDLRHPSNSVRWHALTGRKRAEVAKHHAAPAALLEPWYYPILGCDSAGDGTPGPTKRVFFHPVGGPVKVQPAGTERSGPASNKLAALSASATRVVLVEHGAEEAPFVHCREGMAASLATYTHPDQIPDGLHVGWRRSGNRTLEDPIVEGASVSMLHTSMYSAQVFPHRGSPSDFLLIWSGLPGPSEDVRCTIRSAPRVLLCGHVQPQVVVHEPCWYPLHSEDPRATTTTGSPAPPDVPCVAPVAYQEQLSQRVLSHFARAMRWHSEDAQFVLHSPLEPFIAALGKALKAKEAGEKQPTALQQKRSQGKPGYLQYLRLSAAKAALRAAFVPIGGPEDGRDFFDCDRFVATSSTTEGRQVLAAVSRIKASAEAEAAGTKQGDEQPAAKRRFVRGLEHDGGALPLATLPASPEIVCRAASADAYYWRLQALAVQPDTTTKLVALRASLDGLPGASAAKRRVTLQKLSNALAAAPWAQSKGSLWYTSGHPAVADARSPRDLASMSSPYPPFIDLARLVLTTEELKEYLRYGRNAGAHPQLASAAAAGASDQALLRAHYTAADLQKMTAKEKRDRAALLAAKAQVNLVDHAKFFPLLFQREADVLAAPQPFHPLCPYQLQPHVPFSLFGDTDDGDVFDLFDDEADDAAAKKREAWRLEKSVRSSGIALVDEVLDKGKKELWDAHARRFPVARPEPAPPRPEAVPTPQLQEPAVATPRTKAKRKPQSKKASSKGAARPRKKMN